jgi:hypothetical protein
VRWCGFGVRPCARCPLRGAVVIVNLFADDEVHAGKARGMGVRCPAGEPCEAVNLCSEDFPQVLIKLSLECEL